MRPLTLFFVALLAAAAAFAGEPSSEITPENVVALMNVERAREGLPPLTLERRLSAAARDRMRDMEESGYWSHESPEGMSPFVWLSARAYRYRAAAENLAAGFETANLLVQSWMESRGHRANIMSPEYEDCGVAIIEGSTRGPASGRSVVVLFASEMPPDLVSTKEP